MAAPQQNPQGVTITVPPEMLMGMMTQMQKSGGVSGSGRNSAAEARGGFGGGETPTDFSWSGGGQETWEKKKPSIAGEGASPKTLIGG